MKMFALLLSFFIFIQAKADYLSSVILRDTETKSVLGTGTHLCIGSNNNVMYFLTAAHVVENSQRIEGLTLLSSEPIQFEKIQIDSSLDLALLKSSTSSLTAFLPCYSLPPDSIQNNFFMPKAFDVLSAINPSHHRIYIEGFDSDTGKLRTEVLTAPFVESIQEGLPERENTGALYLTTFKARPGFSGGIVLAHCCFMPHTSATREEDYAWSPIAQHRRVIMGLVIASDISLNRVAIVPSKTISTWIRNISHYKVSSKQRLSKTNGYEDEELQIYVSPSSLSYTSAGLSSYGGVGTGRPAIGSPKSLTQKRGFSLKEKSDKNWISIDGKWVEGDPLNQDTKQEIKTNRQNLKGMYLDSKDRLYKTEGSTFPEIISLSKLGKSENDCMMMPFKNLQSKEIEDVFVCEEIGLKEAVYKIKTKTIDMRVKLIETTQGQVLVDSKINDSGANLKTLRLLESNHHQIKMEGLSGIEILDKSNKTILIGPVR